MSLAALLVHRRLEGRARIWFLALFAGVTVLRLWFCALAPNDSSDLFRHLGFTSHFWEHPELFYWITPELFPNEHWSTFWTEVGYIYPPVALLFFTVFGTLGIGLFWVKLSLTLFDLASSILIGRVTTPWAGLLVFSAPVSVWYTSHEGQYESLVTLLVVLSVLAVRSGRWMGAGAFFMLALQTKQLAVLIAPYLLYELFIRKHLDPRAAWTRFLAGFLVTMLPFLPFYWWRPDLWLLPLQNQENVLNPFFWPLPWGHHPVDHFEGVSFLRIVWDETVSILPLMMLAIFVSRGYPLRRIPQALPSASFWLLIKSLSWVMNWYMILLPGLVLALWRHRRWMMVMMVFYWLQCGQQISRYIGKGDDDMEDTEDITRFHDALWHYDYRTP